MTRSKPKRTASITLETATQIFDGVALPPEVLTMILKPLFLDGGWEVMLQYRLVNSQWREIINSFLEKAVLSGELPVPPFPEFRAVSAERLTAFPTVRYTSTLLQTTNPFPFNSLFLTRKYSERKQKRNEISMPMPEFVTSFGANLTSFAFHDPIISIRNLAMILGSMQSLKLISISDGNLRHFSNVDNVLPSAPPLPKLTTLEIKSGYHASSFVRKRRNILYLWLIGSYADQLVSLSLQTEDPLPALQPNHQYSEVVRSNVPILAASTSASAFGKLEELKIYCPHRQFLQHSLTPALRRLSVLGWAGLARAKHLDFQCLTNYVDKCASTLEKLYLDVYVRDLLLFRWGSLAWDPRPLATRVTQLPHLKTLAFRFPSDISEYHTMVERNFLFKFPALESLQLLHFRQFPERDEEEHDCENPELVIEDDRKITAFHDRLTVYAAQTTVVTHNAYLEMVAACQEFASTPPDEKILLARARERLEAAIREQKLANERRMIAEKKLGPGKRVAEKYIILHGLLKGEKVWNNCGELKRISVSSGKNPNGNICVRSRPIN